MIKVKVLKPRMTVDSREIHSNFYLGVKLTDDLFERRCRISITR